MEIAPFRAYRYDPTRVSIGDVVTQPYDKISPQMQARYYQASPFNLVRIILGDPKLEKPDVYQAAAEHFREWRDQGVLRADPEPSLYTYCQRFTPAGATKEMERRAFIALGRIYEYSDAVVFRHELTHAKPKQDRLDLLRATRAQFEQLFMLYSDPRGRIDGLLLKTASTPEIRVRDEYGVEHRLSRCGERDVVRQVVGLMADKKIIIADGHHRYETAQDYHDERCATSGGKTDAASAFAIMTFVNMDAPGLLILPTHRVISGVPGFDKDLFLRSAFPYFTVEQSAAADPVRLFPLLDHAGQQGTAFVAVIGHEAFLLRARPGAADSVLAGVPARQRELDLVHLHKILLEHVLGLSEESIRLQQNIRYVREAGEAIQQAQGGANVAFLVNPVRVDQVRDIAFAGEVLPQKSTDFYPKLLSGLAIYAME
ncbi:MAG TPA: DUF1015 domain-containing protein [Terriglobales bacterium]|nr:DUF1015 domain-containing protein [Terriglobales bacterium]